MWGRPLSRQELGGDQLDELGRDVCHRVFSSTQVASRAEQGADIAESFVCRAVHDGDEEVTRSNHSGEIGSPALCLA